MNDIEKLIDSICDAEYEYKDYKGKLSTTTVVNRYSESVSAARAAIAKVVYEWLSEQMTDIEKNRRIGALEAKCYAYEQIIAKSNFSPFITTED